MQAALETAAELGYKTEIGQHEANDPEDSDTADWTIRFTRNP